jgi:predicted RecA/RadA family phage recombinase
MKNYLQHGDTVPLTAPGGGVVGGAFYLIGLIFGCAAHDAVATASFELRRKGVFTGVAKVNTEAWTEGALLYWDDVAKKFTTTAAANKKVAVAAKAALAADLTGTVLLLNYAQ